MADVVRRSNGKAGAAAGRPRPPHDLHALESHLGELINAAALDPAAWQQVADELRHLNPGSRVVIQAHDPSLGRPLVALASGWSDGYTDRYASHFARMNNVSKIWATSAPMLTPVLLPEYVLPVGDFLKSEFYNEGLKSEGEAECGSGIRIFSEGGRQATLVLQYGLRHKDDMHRHFAPLLQRLGPRLRGALLANRQTLRKRTSPLTGDIVNDLVDPALILDRSRRVVCANQAARELVVSSETVRIGARDVFSFSEPQTDAHLATLVEVACQRAPGSSGYLQFDFLHRGCRFHASILPITRSLGLANKGLACLLSFDPAVLLVLRTEPPSEKKNELQVRFQLTNAELRIAQALTRKGSLIQIADELGIAYETARNQVKSALRKTGTHTQRELVSLFLQKE